MVIVYLAGRDRSEPDEDVQQGTAGGDKSLPS
jgi:hypothetical protein